VSREISQRVRALCKGERIADCGRLRTACCVLRTKYASPIPRSAIQINPHSAVRNPQSALPRHIGCFQLPYADFPRPFD